MLIGPTKMRKDTKKISDIQNFGLELGLGSALGFRVIFNTLVLILHSQNCFVLLFE